MIVTSIINYKGGVGKTTLTSNLAAELGAKGHRVLAIDLDPQANLTFSFISVDDWENHYRDRTIKTWFDAFLNRDKDMPELSTLIVNPDKVRSKSSHVDLICSHLSLINVDIELAVLLNGIYPRQYRKNFLEVYSCLARGLRTKQIEERYDIVLIDCPPNFNIVTGNALLASDNYIIPAKPDFLSTIGITELKRHVKELVDSYNSHIAITDASGKYTKAEPDLLGVAFNMVSLYKGLPIQAEQQYISSVTTGGIPTFSTILRENKTEYGTAPQYGLPLVLKISNTNNEIKQELQAIAREFAEKVGLKYA